MPDKLRILTVDDEEIDRLAIRRALLGSDLDVELEEARGIVSAREALSRASFDCIVLDYHLGDGRATDLLREGVADPTDLPPVIILTGSGSERVAVELMKAGAMDYLPKDELTPSRIAQSVRNTLRMRSSEEALRRAYEDLEQRVVERTSALASAYREIEQEMASRRDAESRSRRHLEQLAHVSRLSTLGEMAASIAHELNQPLGAVANYANGCLRRIEAGTADLGTLFRAFTHIAVQAERAGKIIHRLRAFVATREPMKETSDLNALLCEVVDLETVEAQQREVKVALELEEDLPPVEVDPIQIQQVILNLVRNGIDAMEAVESEDARQLTLRTQVEDGGVAVLVSDRGPGCDDETLERLFEPFFTTKNGGMGMGLAISRSLAEAHGGDLSVGPCLEGGLTFRLTIPVEGRA